VIGFLPEITVQPTEEIYSLQVPTPPEVIGKLSEAL